MTRIVNFSMRAERMGTFFTFAFGLLALSAQTLANPGHGSEEAAWQALRAGGYVALMRHTDAPGAPGDPPGFKLEDCATQRNLSPRGRAEAIAAGQSLRKAGVTIGRVVSSPWCRCIETARLMEVGDVAIEPAFANAHSLSDRRAELASSGKAVINAWRQPATLLIVTHGANIAAITGISPASGEIVVVAPSDQAASLRIVGRIAPPVP